jgi:hypothetical protein
MNDAEKKDADLSELADVALKGFDICTCVFDRIPDTEMQISLICMLIDHVCERRGLKKEETLERIRKSVEKINAKLGSMYGRPMNELDG